MAQAAATAGRHHTADKPAARQPADPMPKKEFTRWLESGFLFAWRDIHAGKTTAFRVVFLAEVGGKFHCITRYDTAHGYAHRDVQGLTEG